ncbi:hypothetical protein [Ethanoligenens harbinense]|uniref:Uncharacterized protein n=1 Tax=Ethanoligenens harbinense (strain DSM 18485 / JCM 12961 / CGMCC 1.5033 / YUAN-3) TaxID=663278 RepID=E6U7S2_ETHHY|nr:hypothetical protein [Ethanoligenens harbinense]ADU28195.1 hypothetical protein Ethha_2702 [Ethanoligenens harbinense YUAN-3]AVQ97195.1 hypothetical protein CXQ68_13860 [Ethanoligenens harbinense YUAN-3]AYF39858.1 hypothetical protein CXP51_13760 [Ethanoligenens harbinense]AYF42690.1 hypothetical protein CN246_14340 [Ethanoligenens harbinense]QCN93440.1 hypothetical protein DRA42_13910 [Ethanoligenens harbinense]
MKKPIHIFNIVFEFILTGLFGIWAVYYFVTGHSLPDVLLMAGVASLSLFLGIFALCRRHAFLKNSRP